GIRRWNVDVMGSANHAGTTPMDQRTDALVGASELIVAIRDIASSAPGRQVATVGRISVEPGAPNVIPGAARFTLEIRDLSMDRIDQVFQAIQAVAQEADRSTGLHTRFERFYESLGAPTDPRLRQLVEDSANAAGFSTLRMPSGAGHDAQSMAELGPVGMVFVPSRAGISHSPDEWTAPDDVARGTEVLFHTLLAMDTADLPWPA
ncbi:MAG: M20/M25/M40 family metallo-hydrolase, partial [Gemmatimonadetes bacterium]|nr:M20/M25/M40 family metallo-hydrolase [Gemmatimonadota bacterium]